MSTTIGAGGPKELKMKNISFNGNNDTYYNKTRELCFIRAFKRIDEYKIKTGLDIACSNGHSVYIANKQCLNFKGCDIEFNNEYNDIFIDTFGELKLFKLEFNDLINHNHNYDIITSFNITHVFDDKSMEYLIKIISNKAKYCYLHIDPRIIDNIKKNLSSRIDIIQIFEDDINAGPGAMKWYYIFIKFKDKIKVDQIYKFIRSNYLITITH